MSDFAFLLDDFNLIVLLACLAAGYVIKHATFLKKIPNDDIPCILAVIGLILNMVVSGFTVKDAVYGAVTGLASTGMHQAFSRFVEGKTNIKKGA